MSFKLFQRNFGLFESMPLPYRYSSTRPLPPGFRGHGQSSDTGYVDKKFHNKNSECFDGCPCEGSGNEYCSAPVNLVLLKPYNIFGGEHKDYLWSWDGPARETSTEFSQSELAPYRSCSYMVQNRMFLAGSQAGVLGLDDTWNI